MLTLCGTFNGCSQNWNYSSKFIFVLFPISWCLSIFYDLRNCRQWLSNLTTSGVTKIQAAGHSSEGFSWLNHLIWEDASQIWIIWGWKAQPKSGPHPEAAHIKGHREACAFCLHVLTLTGRFLSCCCGIPSLGLESTTSGTQQRQDLLKHPLKNYWIFGLSIEVPIVGLARPQPLKPP